jgi:hypothetical protein
MAAFASSTTFSSDYVRTPKTVDFDFDDDGELFSDCVDKQVDVFDFLELERDYTSVSSSSSSLDDGEENSVVSNSSETVYLEAALHDDFADGGGEQRELFDEDRVVSQRVAPTIEEESSSSSPSSEERSNERQNNHHDNQDDGNPIAHAVHIAQNIWKGSKNTPVGFAVHMTEGVFGHLLGMIHHDNDNDKKNQGEEVDRTQVEEDTCDDPSNSNEVIAPYIEEESGILEVSDDDQSGAGGGLASDDWKRRLELSIDTGHSASVASSQDEDWLPLE